MNLVEKKHDKLHEESYTGNIKPDHDMDIFQRYLLFYINVFDTVLRTNINLQNVVVPLYLSWNLSCDYIY